MKCKRCRSYAINHHCHGRDGSGEDLCDVCYWRNIAETRLQKITHLESALRRIANQDYRGNRSTESQIAFEVLKEAKP